MFAKTSFWKANTYALAHKWAHAVVPEQIRNIRSYDTSRNFDSLSRKLWMSKEQNTVICRVYFIHGFVDIFSPIFEIAIYVMAISFSKISFSQCLIFPSWETATTWNTVLQCWNYVSCYIGIMGQNQEIQEEKLLPKINMLE